MYMYFKPIFLLQDLFYKHDLNKTHQPIQSNIKTFITTSWEKIKHDMDAYKSLTA